MLVVFGATSPACVGEGPAFAAGGVTTWYSVPGSYYWSSRGMKSLKAVVYATWPAENRSTMSPSP